MTEAQIPGWLLDHFSRKIIEIATYFFMVNFLVSGRWRVNIILVRCLVWLASDQEFGGKQLTCKSLS